MDEGTAQLSLEDQQDLTNKVYICSSCNGRSRILLMCIAHLQGKNYVVLDGDVIFFKFNVTSTGKK